LSGLARLVTPPPRRRVAGPADTALSLGIPSVRLVVPDTGQTDSAAAAARALAATVRRLDGLDSAPVLEDQFVLAGGRVWLRRDLYWLGLAVWLALYWRGRARPGQELRWLLLATWLVTPVFAAILLTLPAAVAAWRPGVRWPAGVALLPAAIYGERWIAALAGGSLPAIAVLPTLLVTATLSLFCWHQVCRDTGAGP
jgi:hypothetical protein